jgi:uncharacterized membrane protein
LFETLFKYPRDDFLRGDVILGNSWPFWLVAFLAVVALTGITVALLRRHRDIGRWRLAMIGFLQAAMIFVVATILLQPAIQTDRLRQGENSLALVLDGSESMQNGDTTTRFDDAIDNLTSTLVESVSGEFDVRHFVLADDASGVESFADSQPTGSATSIYASLRSVLQEGRDRSLAAIILASDGIDTAGGISSEQLAELAALGVPVHTIGVGRDALPEDLELSQVVVPSSAMPSSTIPARVSIRHDAPADARIKVYDGDELLASVAVELPADTTTTTTWVDVRLDNAGYHQLRFSVEGSADEPELRNNHQSALIKVEQQKYRVLYFEGEPRWEYKFLRRAVRDDGDTSLASLLRVSPNKYYRQGLDSAEQLEEGFPVTRDELFSYDALIIGSVEAASLSDEQLANIRSFVSERGGSLLMLAGSNGLGNGGWGQSGIADLLPTRLPASTVDSFVREKVAARLTPQGASTQMLRFGESDAENQRLWDELPEVADYQQVGDLKPAARTLVNVIVDGQQQPLLISQPFGRGHSYILATSGTWRWQMSLPVEDERHERFWRQLLRALVSSSPQRTSLQVDSRDGSTLEIRAEFRDEAFNPVDNLTVSAVASHESGESWSIDLLPSENETGVFIAETKSGNSGAWYFEALATREGNVIEVARSSIYSEAAQKEYFNIRRNSALLKRVSEATGGQYFDAGELDALPDFLRHSSAGITEKVIRPIWDMPAVFLLLLLLKAGEWLLRRRWSTI